MTFRPSQLKYEKTWRLRKEQTHMRKALKQCRVKPDGLSRLVGESLEFELGCIAAELKRRREEGK